MFERASWQSDRMLLDNLIFRLEHYKNDQWELGDRCFAFYKIKPLIDQYEHAFSHRPGLRPKNLLEIGMWDGGSLAFWNEILHPDKIVGVDLNAREDSAYFRDYVPARGLESKLRSYWGTNQADERALLGIVEREFGEALDMVIDDASHIYEPTLASFQILFPLLPPGGLYIIEDWAWEHWKEFHSPSHPWARHRSPTRLVFELIEATGTSQHLIASVEVFQGFIIVERGPAPASDISPLLLAQQIARRPSITVVHRTLDRGFAKLRSAHRVVGASLAKLMSAQRAGHDRNR
jgi:cephalosporin hydroxylase